MTDGLQGALVALAGAGWLALLARAVLVAARMFQIEEYEAPRLFDWGGTRAWSLHTSALAAAAPVAVATLFSVADLARPGLRLALAASWLVGVAAAQAVWRWLPPKKELVFTPRMRRLLATTALLAALLGALVCIAVELAPPWLGGAAAAVIGIGVTTLALVLPATANIINAPVEAQVRRGFLRHARRRLEAVHPLVIAVAGSYGKTSTKHILAEMLERYGPTLATPKSFNTLMGVSKTINQNLEDRHRTFVVEMDAYGPREIASICALVHPTHALLTSVGPQHLERFGTIERIGDALYETIDALPTDGFAVVYAGDQQTAGLAARARAAGHEVIRYGIEDGSADVDVVAANVQITGTGSRFTWRWTAAGLEHDIAVPLLGRHQVLNVSAALATVHRLGLPLEPALDAVASLRPVDHRLQPVATGNAITVIDDSYNANPVGVHNGLEVLAEMDARQRILVTPGLVELGSVEDAENRRYGEHAAQVCDHVIVMDARPARALREGLHAGGMPDDHVHLVRSLVQATEVIGGIAGPGDAVLFANDLPDTYLGAA
ncbi:MAG: UDP-N-acetylmuramoyl-tripeptide--D-alanyl-D-alanine ligase [Candidatus Dormibacteraeota bacterium]|uniref:UDP-N-acetylmuramoyl-tripeptide--D-alanyl-D-alanine ligase n=1 Tax=Candidatus Aeolococcus gillhamiae TaxID=3127015 RepID=A0A2W6A4G9_9BACT|nr:UDP-N-acetylmuramoyl-tripeptide--D-alanyl-D-alanine ligase [Candidatus Dormibacteraeota bacterium]PZR78494.1 MAG: UDP-N-acetylmuramoyl-tripeptide--D-alanyl-D-alanine ligase [Candidatus Dormibacter sp. RRmetagenome_bin12]